MYLLGAGVVRCTWVRAVGLARAVPRAGRRELHPPRGRGLVGPSRAVGELPLPRHWVARPGRARGLGALADEDALERVAGTVVEEERLLGAVEVEGVLLEASLGQFAVLGAQAVLIWTSTHARCQRPQKGTDGATGELPGGEGTTEQQVEQRTAASVVVRDGPADLDLGARDKAVQPFFDEESARRRKGSGGTYRVPDGAYGSTLVPRSPIVALYFAERTVVKTASPPPPGCSEGVVPPAMPHGSATGAAPGYRQGK
eukprot:COSAG04_NODE_310_length_17225_cov_12.768014_13_plen_257_part_00